MTTKLAAILGNPLEHTLSPMLHNAAFKELSLDWIYFPLEITQESVSKAADLIKNANFGGLNITMPHKEAFIEFLAHKDKTVELSGSVNTVVVHNKKFYGYNTDIYGITKTLENSLKTDIKARKALIIGAGGVARAAAVSLVGLDITEFLIMNRNVERAHVLAAFINERLAVSSEVLNKDAIQDGAKSADIIINATPVGMFPGEGSSPLDASLLQEGQVVMDLIYRPTYTKLLQEAQKRGCTVVSGLGVFLYQAVEAFKLWTDREPPIKLMSEILGYERS